MIFCLFQSLAFVWPRLLIQPACVYMMERCRQRYNYKSIDPRPLISTFIEFLINDIIFDFATCALPCSCRRCFPPRVPSAFLHPPHALHSRTPQFQQKHLICLLLFLKLPTCRLQHHMVHIIWHELTPLTISMYIRVEVTYSEAYMKNEYQLDLRCV